MLESYLIAGARALLRERAHLALNVAGLAVGLAATLLVLSYVEFERSYDKFQPHLQSSYRLAQVPKEAGEIRDSLIPGYSCSLAVMRIAERMPEVKAVFGLFPLVRDSGAEVEVNGQNFLLNNLFAATRNISDFVKVDVLAGSLDDALAAPGRIALSRREAVRFFGRSDIIGQTITQKSGRWTVAAVFADLPPNTHFSFTSLTWADPDRNAERFWALAYVRLAEQVDVKALAEKIRRQIEAQSFQSWQIGLLPVGKIHLKSDNNETTIGICVALSLLLIGIASFNYVNMSTAQAARRAREVGVRKALGSSRFQLITQFLTESVLVACIAAGLAILLVKWTLAAFSRLVSTQLSADWLGSLGAGVVVIALVVGILAGLYPAVFISSFSARRVLSGDLQRGRTAIVVRSALLVIQAGFSVCLITATLVIFQQMSYLNGLSVGYARTARMEVRGLKPASVFDQHNSGVIGALERIDGVVGAAAFDRSLTDGYGSVAQLVYPNSPDKKHVAAFSGAGFGFVETVGLDLVAGRDFATEFPGDWYHKDEQGVERAAVDITESMARSAGYATPADAVGREFKLGLDGRSTDFIANVVGVVRDVKVGSVREQQYPMFFICGFSSAPESTLVVHYNGGNVDRIRNDVAQTVAKYLGVHNADIRLIEDDYAAIYEFERRQAELVLVFCGLAIFLTCVGVFGLAAFSAQRRSREVAIRKTLGASRLGLINLLSRQYMLLIGISCLGAFPVAFYVTQDWLSNFNDRVSQSVLTYVLAAALTAGIVWLTTSIVGFRAASTRPTQVLRHD